MRFLPFALFAAVLAVPVAREVRVDKFDDTHAAFENERTRAGRDRFDETHAPFVNFERTPFTCATGEPAALGVGAVALGLVLRRRR